MQGCKIPQIIYIQLLVDPFSFGKTKMQVGHFKFTIIIFITAVDFEILV